MITGLKESWKLFASFITAIAAIIAIIAIEIPPSFIKPLVVGLILTIPFLLTLLFRKNTSKDSIIQNNFLFKRSRNGLPRVISETILKYTRKNEAIIIQALGINQRSLRSTIDDLLSSSAKINNLNLDVILLQDKSNASNLRMDFENKNQERITKSLENSQKGWKEIGERLVKSGTNNAFNIKVISTHIPHYMIRINNMMIVSPYLLDSGHKGYYYMIDSNQNETSQFAFNKHIEYFKKLFKSKKHTSKI